MRPFLLLGLTLVAAPAAAQNADFTWHGTIPAGQTIEIKGVNGSVRAEGTSGGEVAVSASKHARRSDPADVKIEVVKHAGGVTICAMYPTPSGAHPNTCEPGDRGHVSTNNNDVTVDFTVQVPASVRFVGHTVNGDVEASGLVADAEVSTVNGDASVETRGVARARTVNGNVDASMGNTGWDGSVHLATVNGSVSVALPASAKLTVDGKTVNGDIDTDFPLTIRGKWGPRHVSGTIGGGGSQLEMETVNGGINIKRR